MSYSEPTLFEVPEPAPVAPPSLAQIQRDLRPRWSGLPRQAQALRQLRARPARGEQGCAPVRFYLGTHQPGWLSWVGVPLFVSDVRLREYKSLPAAAAPWALDSGGFSIISAGRQFDPPQEYIARVRRYQRTIGKLAWAAPQDWMCEPFIVAKTGLSVTEHQWRTIDNLFDLRRQAPDLPFIPVLQGFEVDDYLTHVDFYRNVGIDLRDEPLVGVGSICRRQGETVAGEIFQALHDAGVKRLHGFGLKKRGLARFGHLLDSADSMAWSFDARRRPPLAGCLLHKNCANCSRYALQWRTQLLTDLSPVGTAA